MDMYGGIAAIIGGIFCICACVFNWEFFFNNYKARHIVNGFGKNGAKLFYMALGIFLIVAGIVIMADS